MQLKTLEPANNGCLDDSNMSELMRENIKYLRPYIRQDITDIHINRPFEVFVKHANGTSP